MAEFLQSHKVVYFHCPCIAYAINIVSSEVDKHDVLGAVFLRRLEFIAEPLILCKPKKNKDIQSSLVKLTPVCPPYLQQFSRASSCPQ